MLEMTPIRFDKKIVAIVMFGPATEMSGMRPAEYYQVTIDPAFVSNSGEYIKFGVHPGDEIQGWQRIEALTVVEVLEAEWQDDGRVKIIVGHDAVEMMVLSEKRVDSPS